jgi:hypothetical protein
VRREDCPEEKKERLTQELHSLVQGNIKVQWCVSLQIIRKYRLLAVSSSGEDRLIFFRICIRGSVSPELRIREAS